MMFNAHDDEAMLRSISDVRHTDGYREASLAAFVVGILGVLFFAAVPVPLPLFPKVALVLFASVGAGWAVRHRFAMAPLRRRAALDAEVRASREQETQKQLAAMRQAEATTRHEGAE